MEEWENIDGYNGNYEVSNKGRIRSWKNNKWGKSDKYKIMSAVISKNKYPQVVLCNNGSTKRHYIHRLVAKAFIPNPENKPNINHKDLDPTNNHIDNLEWCTQSENMKHAYDNGTHKVPNLKGEDHARSKFTENDVIEIRNTYSNNSDITQRELAKKYNVSQTAIWSILNNKTWKDAGNS